jgi:hypothetical protein
MLSGAQNVKYSDRMLCNFKHGEGILAIGQWTGEDGVPNVVWREGSQRVAKLGVVIHVGYFHNNNVQGRGGHDS